MKTEHTRRQKNMTVYLLDRHIEALEKLALFQECSKSMVIRRLIDKATGYKKKLGTIYPLDRGGLEEYN